MSFQVEWLVKQQIILARDSGEITVDLLAMQDVQIIELLAESRQNNLTHVIVDLRAVTKFPTNIGEINQYANTRKQANLGWILVVNDNRLIRFVANVVTQLTKTRFRNFDSMEEAIDFLKTQDSTIDWSLLVALDDKGID